jgi:hypothetical protein
MIRDPERVVDVGNLPGALQSYQSTMTPAQTLFA